MTIDLAQLKPHERPLAPGVPATPDFPTRKRLAYGLVAVLVGITSGLGSALVAVNAPSMQGALGLDTVQVAWLPTVYLMTNVSANLLVIKFRQQFGLRQFTKWLLVAYLLMTVAHLLVTDFATAVTVRAISGIAGAALSTLSIYYMLQVFPGTHRPKALVLGMTLSMLAAPLAQVFSPLLLDLASWHSLYVLELGLVLLSLVSVALLKLPPAIQIQTLRKGDFLSFLLLAPGLALLCAVLGLGRTLWWTDAPWLGRALCAAIVLIAAGLAVEHRRDQPLIDTRWLGTRTFVRFLVMATLVRAVLAGQTSASMGLMGAVGMGPDQLRWMQAVVLLATLAGIATTTLTLSGKNPARHFLLSVGLIAVAAFLDGRATNLTRPEQLYFTQFLLGFAGATFLGSALLLGFRQFQARGAQAAVTFFVMFGITQTFGGLLGSAFFSSLQFARARFYHAQLLSHLLGSNPLVAARLQANGGLLSSTLTDPGLRTAQGGALLAQQALREAQVLAFNDVFLSIGVVAVLTLLFSAYAFLRSAPRPPAASPIPQGAVPSLSH